MSGLLESLAVALGNSAVVGFLKRVLGFGHDGSSTIDQSNKLIETLPDVMESTEDLKDALEGLDGFTAKRTKEREGFLPPKTTETKEVRFD